MLKIAIMDRGTMLSAGVLMLFAITAIIILVIKQRKI